MSEKIQVGELGALVLFIYLFTYLSFFILSMKRNTQRASRITLTFSHLNDLLNVAVLKKKNTTHEERNVHADIFGEKLFKQL